MLGKKKQTDNLKSINFAVPKSQNLKPRKLKKLEAVYSYKKKNLLERKKQDRKTAIFSLSVFLVLGIMLLSPIKLYTYFKEAKASQETILNASFDAVSDFESAKNAISYLDLKNANQKFIAAANNFSRANEEVNNLSPFLTTLAKLHPTKQKQLETARAMTEIGEDIANGGRYLTLAIASWEDLTTNTLTEKLRESHKNLAAATPYVVDANKTLAEIDPSVLSSYNLDLWRTLRDGLPTLKTSLQKFLIFQKAGLNILGEERKKRYLIIFQNNGELRATGGFMGSFALVDIDRGKITNIEFPGGGFYDLDGTFNHHIIPPKGLDKLTNHWEAQDANWWPDFPTSAQKIAWFYQEGAGRSVDGVLAINVSIVPKLLDLFGPIEMQEYGKTLTSENFILETQKAVELEYDREKNRPKQILADMAPILLQRIFATKQADWPMVADIVHQALENREVQIFMQDNELQNMIEILNWSGSIKKSNSYQDFLMVVHSNIGGQKSDAVIDDQLFYTVTINEKTERVMAQLTIERTHNAQKGELFYEAQNNDYIRVYVPNGSKLVSVEGAGDASELIAPAVATYAQFDNDVRRIENNIRTDATSKTRVYEEFGKTVFANWLLTKPQTTNSITFTYELPFQITEHDPSYNLLVQKQSGIDEYDLSFMLQPPREWQATTLEENTVQQGEWHILEKKHIINDESLYFEFTP